MKSIVTILTLTFSLQSFAAIYTKLNVPAQPSSYKINKAIKALKKASTGINKASNLKEARDLIKMTTKKVRYNAAIYVNGNKQFNDIGDEVLSWNFSGYCFKGEASVASDLINKALELGYWESDEEWIEKATAISKTEIELLLIDGPNEYDWTVKIGTCSKK